MRQARMWLGSVVLLMIAGCAQEAPTVDVAAETEALRAAELAYHAAAVARDANAVAEFYIADAIMYPPNEPTRSGSDAVADFAAAFTSAPGLQMSFELLDVAVGEGGTMGYTRTEGVATMDGPDGETVRQQLRDVHIWVKDQSGEWKLSVDVWNSSDPLPGG